MKNIFLNNFTVTRQRRNAKDHYKSVVIWFTGLSGSGKTTLAQAVEEKLHQAYCRTMLLDGDNIRHGLCKDLGFSNEDRKENIRRIGEVAKLFIESGAITLVSFISPFKEGRDKVKELLGGGLRYTLNALLMFAKIEMLKVCIRNPEPMKLRTLQGSIPYTKHQ